jgi:hypothetical protein
MALAIPFYDKQCPPITSIRYFPLIRKNRCRFKWPFSSPEPLFMLLSLIREYKEEFLGQGKAIFLIS